MAKKSDKPAKRRRGKVLPASKPGEAARFEPGDAAGPVVFDAGALAAKHNLWWENGDGRSMMMMSPDGDWLRMPEKRVVQILKRNFVAMKAREDERLSEMERVLLWVAEKRHLEHAMIGLAGYPAGVHALSVGRVLVRMGPRLLAPAPGDWPTVRALIEGRLDLRGEAEGGVAGVDQSPFFYGWLKIAVETLYGVQEARHGKGAVGGVWKAAVGDFRPGQMLVFAGPRDCGKSRLQHQVITPLLGGRSADPGPYMFGQTDFNGEIFESEHLLMEDPPTTSDKQDRAHFAEKIKGLVVNDTQRLHRKRADALTVSPFWRATLSVNDDPDKMRVLPMLTPDIRDKMMIFRCASKPLPMPTTTSEERRAFRDTLMGELPHFLHWLLHEYEVPAAMVSRRFGVKEFQHPDLVGELFDDTPAGELMRLIDEALFEGLAANGQKRLWEMPSFVPETEGVSWEGTAIELSRLLTGEGMIDGLQIRCTVAKEAERLLKFHKVERLLSRLKEDEPDRVAQVRRMHARHWMVAAPPVV